MPVYVLGALRDLSRGPFRTTTDPVHARSPSTGSRTQWSWSEHLVDNAGGGQIESTLGSFETLPSPWSTFLRRLPVRSGRLGDRPVRDRAAIGPRPAPGNR